MTYRPGVSTYQSMTKCSVDCCSRRATLLGFCHSHYRRFKRGRPLDAPIRNYNRKEVAGSNNFGTQHKSLDVSRDLDYKDSHAHDLDLPRHVA